MKTLLYLLSGVIPSLIINIWDFNVISHEIIATIIEATTKPKIKEADILLFLCQKLGCHNYLNLGVMETHGKEY